jgi:hypothetical protein
MGATAEATNMQEPAALSGTITRVKTVAGLPTVFEGGGSLSEVLVCDGGCRSWHVAGFSGHLWRIESGHQGDG